MRDRGDAGAGGRLRRVLGRLPLDGEAAASATALTVVAVVVLVSLQGAVGAAITSGEQPVGAVENVPETAGSEQWADAPARTMTLSGQQMAIPYGGGSVDEMAVSALTNESHVAFRLAWADPTPNDDISEPRNYSDAAGLMFGTGESPPITMGATGDPVNIWYWRAAWESDERPGGVGDMYSYHRNETLTQPGRHVDNPLSRAHYDRRGQNYYAEGYGSLSYAPDQHVDAGGTRTDDGWAVTFVRERSSATEHAVDFATNETVYLTVAVWNGSADEVNGRKSLSYQYSTLDAGTGELASADGDGGGDDGSDGSVSAGDSGDSGDSDGSMSVGGFVGGVVLAAVLVWFVTYRRAL